MKHHIGKVVDSTLNGWNLDCIAATLEQGLAEADKSHIRNMILGQKLDCSPSECEYALMEQLRALSIESDMEQARRRS